MKLMILVIVIKNKFEKDDDNNNNDNNNKNNNNNDDNNNNNNKAVFVYPVHDSGIYVKVFNLPCTVLYFKTVADSLMQENLSYKTKNVNSFPNDLVLLIMKYLHIKYMPVDLEILYLNDARFA